MLLNPAKYLIKASNRRCPSLRDAKSKPSKHQFPFCSLFLSSLSLSRIPCALLTGTLVSGVASGDTEGSVGTSLERSGHLALLDLLDGDVGRSNGEDGGDGGSLVDLGEIGLGVTLLGGVGSAGEEDQALLVGLEAGDVGGQGLLGEVLSAGVDRNADGGSELAGNTSLL